MTCKQLSIKVGSIVKVSRAYGGGFGRILDIPTKDREYVVVKRGKKSKIYHVSDITIIAE